MSRKEGIVAVVAFTVIILTLTLASPLILAEEIRIDSIGDQHIGREVTVSGVIIAIASNIEPSKEVSVGIQTFEPGDTGVITIDDGTASIQVSCAPALLSTFYKGQRVRVSGIYAGKGLIYADTVNVDAAVGYRDVTIKELQDAPTYYYAQSVRIQGIIRRIELTAGQTEVELDDGTGTLAVEYRAELKNVSVGDETVVEGKFYRNKLFAFTVSTAAAEPEVIPEPSPTPSPTPTPTLTPSPTATPNPTAPPTPEPPAKLGMPIYLYVIIIAGVAIIGSLFALKVRELLILRRYGK
jgi:cytochrome c-type biogenesis protein CcmE